VVYIIGLCTINVIFFLWRCSPTRAMASSILRFLYHTQRCITVGRTPLDEWSARRRDLYMTTHNTHNRQTSMPPVEFEPTISAGERPQTYALDRAATGIGMNVIYKSYYPKLITGQFEIAGSSPRSIHSHAESNNAQTYCRVREILRELWIISTLLVISTHWKPV